MVSSEVCRKDNRTHKKPKSELYEQESHRKKCGKQFIKDTDKQLNRNKVKDGGWKCFVSGQCSEETDEQQGRNSSLKNLERWSDKQSLEIRGG